MRCLGSWILAVGVAAVCAGAPVAAPYDANPAAGQFVAVNGIRLYCEVYGEGAPLVVLHGNGGNLAAMHCQIDFFRTHRQVIAVDSRGHGRSEMGEGRLTFEQMADDVAALLKARKAGPADLLGWSDGGIVALLVALRHPEAVRRVAVSGANLSPEALPASDLAAMAADLREAERQRAAGDHSRPWDIVCQHLQLMVTQPHISTADLAHITVPVLVLAGEHDLIPEAHTRAIAAGLPHATLHIFAGAGHGALQEVPDAFNARVSEFLRTGP